MTNNKTIVTYTLSLDIMHTEPGMVNRVEYVKFYSLFAARYYAIRLLACVDIAHMDLVDNSTGEVLFIAKDGRVTYEVDPD